MEADESMVGVGSEVVTVWNRMRGKATITKESRTHWHILWFGKPLLIPKERRDSDSVGCRNVSQNVGGAVVVCLTQKGADDHGFIERNRHKIAEAIYRTTDADILRQIAALVGHKEMP